MDDVDNRDELEVNEFDESQNNEIEQTQESDSLFESRLNLGSLQQSIQSIRTEIRKIIVGQQELVDLLLVALLAEGHVLIEGVPGVAKTLTAKLLAKTIATNFSRIQFTPDLMPSDVTGTTVFNFKTSEFDFKKGPIFSNLILIDEINRAPAKTQAALFEVMEEKQITADGVRFKMEEPFMVLATQNPIEQEGTYRLPEAQLDRFLFKIEVGYPTLEEETSIIEGFHENDNQHRIDDIQAVVTPEQLADFKKVARSVKVEKNLIQYIAQIVHKTREDKSLYLGASPRASLAILATAKSYAIIQGRDFVTPEDIQYLAIPVLNHRVILTPDREMEGITTEQVIKQMIAQIEVPR